MNLQQNFIESIEFFLYDILGFYKTQVKKMSEESGGRHLFRPVDYRERILRFSQLKRSVREARIDEGLLADAEAAVQESNNIFNQCLNQFNAVLDGQIELARTIEKKSLGEKVDKHQYKQAYQTLQEKMNALRISLLLLDQVYATLTSDN